MKTIWIVLISFVTTAVIAGGGTYYLVNAKAAKDKDNLQAQITTLTTKVADTEKALADVQVIVSATAGWKTYTDAAHGFTVKYPTDWSATKNPLPNSSATILQVNNGSVANGSNTDGFIVNYYGSLTDLKNSGSEYKNITSIDDYINVNNTVTGQETIDGVSAKRIVNKGSDITVSSLIFSKNDHIYIIMIDLPQFSDQDNQIISTINFTS